MNRSRLMAGSAWVVLAMLAGMGTARAAGPQDYAVELLKGREPGKAAKARPARTADIHKTRRSNWWEQGGKVILAQAEAVEPPPQQQARAETPPDPGPPGVLTRQGVLVVEPSIEYTHTDINRFVVGGVAILDTVLVGSIEASRADRDSATATLGLRYGITDRIEAELRVPYMYRNDSVTNTVVSSNQNQTTDLDDHGLGDIEAALHWQMTDAIGNMPALVANLRVKSTTGDGPFDVRRNAAGIEQELATGSGFWGIEPSLTFIAPSDPAVFFGNIGYLWNVKDSSVDKTVTNNTLVREVDPGDAIRIGFGMGLALNEKVSFSIGYQHDFIMTTKTTFANATVESDSLSVGSLSFGVNWQMTDAAALNVNVGIGVTEDAPDVRLMARVPIAIDLLK